MKIRLKIRPKFLMLFFIISFGLSFFNIFPNNEFIGISIEDLSLLFAVACGILTWIILIKLPNPKFEFKWIMLSVALIVLFSSYQSHALFGQALLSGILVQRTFFVWALMYFPLKKAFYYNWFDEKDIKNLIRAIGIIELILFISQYFLYDKIQFLSVNTGNRYGDLRFYFQPIFIDLLFCFEVDNIINNSNKKEKINSIVLIALCLFEVMIVQKFRMTTMGLIICMIFALLIAKGNLKKRLFYFVLIIIAGILILNTTMAQDILFTIFKDNSSTSTLSIREEGRDLYLNMLSNHPILGGGFPHESCYAAKRAAGIFKEIYLVDNGIFGFAYIYGGIGLIWVIALWAKLIKNGFKIFKNDGNLFFLVFPFFFVITCINEVHWYWNNGFMILVLFIVMQSNKLKNQIK